jgi:hypothetical protein
MQGARSGGCGCNSGKWFGFQLTGFVLTPRHDDLDGETNKQLAGPCYPNQPTSSLHSFLQQTAPRISRVKRDAPAMTCLWRAGSGIGDVSAGSLSILPSTMVLSSSEVKCRQSPTPWIRTKGLNRSRIRTEEDRARHPDGMQAACA